MIDARKREDYSSDNDDELPELNSDGGDDDNQGDIVEPEVTMSYMQVMLEQQRKPVAILFQIAEMKPATWTTKSKDKFEITHPTHYHGGACELKTFPGCFHSKFWTLNHLIPGGDTDKVQYTLNHLGSPVNHPDHTQWKTSMTDLVSWCLDLCTNDHTYLHDHDLFVTRIQKQYGDKDQMQNSSTWVSHIKMQGYHNSDKNTPVYANRLLRNWREAGWDEEQHKVMLQDMIWAGLKPYLHPNSRAITKARGRFETIK